MPQILDGKYVRDRIFEELRPRIARLTAAFRAPGLAVVLAGDNAASEIYVRNKVKACEALGVHSEKYTPAESVTTDELLELVGNLNSSPSVDGILVQLPLPGHIDTARVLQAIDPAKDVDGLHPYNLGNLLASRRGPRPCTPLGVIEMLRRYNIPIRGRKAVVAGRSDIVGKPMALLLLHEHATVTVCHSRTADLAAECRRADILVVAIGRPAMLTADFIQPGATVIDVGINRLTSRDEVTRIFDSSPERVLEFQRKGTILVGDVHPLGLAQAGAYSPVPGGVGLLTIAMLISNTTEAAERRLGVCSA